MFKYERTGTYNVTLSTYSGMSVSLAEGVDLEEAKQIVKRRLRAMRRAGYPVDKIGKGEWEIQTPDDAVMIGDREGVLRIRPYVRRYRRILGRKMYV